MWAGYAVAAGSMPCTLVLTAVVCVRLQNGWTALICAAIQNKPGVVKALIAAKANVDAKDEVRIYRSS